jgi:hypothetical protein
MGWRRTTGTKTHFDCTEKYPAKRREEGEKGLSTANTIDHFLTKKSLRRGRSSLFIIEEASQLGSRKFKQILEQTKRSDRVLLIGDRHQHQSIWQAKQGQPG